MKVIAKKTYIQLDGIFKAGDELTIESKLSTKEVVIHSGFIPKVDERRYFQGARKFCEPVIQPIGSFLDYIIITKDGKRYSGLTIRNAIGYKKMSDLFEKVIGD